MRWLLQLSILLFLFASPMIGCAMSSKRQGNFTYGKWDPLQRKEIPVSSAQKDFEQKGVMIHTGMTQMVVKKLWGEPNFVARREKMDKIGIEINADELWSYPWKIDIANRVMKGHILYFKNSLLIKILESSSRIK